MDETEHQPQPHHHRPRRRRIKIAGLVSAVTALVAILTYHAAPAGVQQTITRTITDPGQTTTEVAQTLADSQPGLWHVTHDVDGDTIDVQLGSQKEIVRFLGLDTPETHDPRKPVQCFGEAAAAHTKALLEGKNVRLEPDPTDSDRDKYGRLLRYVYLPDGTLVNAELIRDGYAFAYTVFPLTKLDDFRALEADARQNNRGLWAGCHVDESSQIKQTAGSK
jgi:micrococcal nuclease